MAGNILCHESKNDRLFLIHSLARHPLDADLSYDSRWPGTWKEVPWINAKALMGRIGEQEKPFEIVAESELLAIKKGTLYFAINDPFS